MTAAIHVPMLHLPEPAPRAAYFAVAAHEGEQHVRKFTGESYTVHLAEVAALVWATTGDPLLTAAAWLHDVVEDTRVHPHVIEQMFGTEIAGIVAALTCPHSSTGLRPARMTAYRLQIHSAGYAVQTVKCADIISNLRTCELFKPEFLARYLDEMEQMLAGMKDADPGLYRDALLLHAQKARAFAGVQLTAQASPA